MSKIRVGNTVVKSNEKFKQIQSKVFTSYGYQKVNDFLLNDSRDFRIVFNMLWEKYQSQPQIFYDSTLIKVLEQSKSFKKFILAVNIQTISQMRIPFDKFYIPCLKKCYQDYETHRETDARGWVVGTVAFLGATYPERRKFLSNLIDSLDITENINSGRIIYLDKHLALTYKQDDAKNQALGELLFAARHSEGLWSFDQTDVFVPVKSLRQAKIALANYQGQPRKGELLGNDSVRFSSFLGLDIKDNYAYMPGYEELVNYRGKGFQKR
ncbi:hypothetical protein NIES25_67210 (plasmid) [Nostoc linckia NIES-25]|nr:hypothetical protein NIES22_36390 [Calothrix brevissima NIES-22]BAY80233.1 hypothetical protein NIES25_67210 [Nostoc linckia NIES-25]